MGSFKPGDRVVGGLLLETPGGGYASGFGGFSEYVLAGDHAAMVADGVADEAAGWADVRDPARGACADPGGGRVDAVHVARGIRHLRRLSAARRAGYLDRCAADAGHLVVFDRSAGRSWDEKIFHYRRESGSGADIPV